GVDEAGLPSEYVRRLGQYVKAEGVHDPAFRSTILRGEEIDLGRLPVPFYYPGDGGHYIKAEITDARDPDSGVETEGYHRYQVKGRDTLGVSLHSRRRMFEYQRRGGGTGEKLKGGLVGGADTGAG